MNSIYSIQSTAAGVALNPEWAQAETGGLAAGYGSMAVVKVGIRTALYAYNKDLQTADVYLLTEGAPWVQRAGTQADLTGGPWDSISAVCARE